MSLAKAQEMDAIAIDARDNPVVSNIPWHERKVKFAGFQRVRSDQAGGITVRVADHPEFQATVQAAPTRSRPPAEAAAKGSQKGQQGKERSEPYHRPSGRSWGSQPWYSQSWSSWSGWHGGWHDRTWRD